MKCKERLARYLEENGVAFQMLTHPTAYTAQEVAAAQRVSGKQVAKVVIVRADDRNLMLVLPAALHINFAKLQALVGAKTMRLAKEEEFGGIFPDCDLGAMPPFGNLYGLQVYVDDSLSQAPEIVFQVGTHRDTVKMAYADYARLAQPATADFTA